MQYKTKQNLSAGAVVLYLVFALTLAAGWITNVVWTFKQSEMTNVVIGALGAIIAPIGTLHGIWLWF